MEKVPPYSIAPVVRVANYIDVPEKYCWGPRRIPDYELIFTIRGIFEYEQEGRLWKVEKNNILCIPPNTRHKLSHIRNKAIISCIHFDLLEDATANSNAYRPEPWPQILTKPENPEFFHHLFREVNSSFENTGQDKSHILEALFRCLWVRLSQYWHSEEKQKASQKLEAMTQYLKDNIYQKFDRHALAEKFDYTPEYINYLFRKELGVTPTQFVNHEKILLAFDMLTNRKMAIKDVTEKLGFYDRYHFSKTFKKIIGRPPGQCVNAN